MWRLPIAKKIQLKKSGTHCETLEKCIIFTFLWLLSTDGVTKAFSHKSHLYFLWPSCTTWMWTLSVSFLLKVESHWSHLNVLSPGGGRVGGREGHFVRRTFHCGPAVNTRSSRTAGAAAICRQVIVPAEKTTKRQTTTKQPSSELFLLCVCHFTAQGNKGRINCCGTFYPANIEHVFFSH